MSEAELLQLFRDYRFPHDSLKAAFQDDPARTLELLRTASHGNAAHFSDDVVDFLMERFDAAPRDLFSLLHNLAARGQPERMKLFEGRFGRFPAPAIDALYYVCTNDHALLKPSTIALLCEHCATNPYQAFSALQYVLMHRPELITAPVVKTVVDHLGIAVNQAFYFIREVVKKRPEFTPLCTVALFDCILREPHHYVKREMLSDVVAIAQGSHVKTSLEASLREPPAAGSKRARLLMAILFRQKFRARQRTLLDALDHAAAWPPVWHFLVFLLDRSSGKTLSSAAAEEFLEGAYRLSLLVEPHEYERLLVERLDLTSRVPAPFPPAAAFLQKDAELAGLFATVVTLAKRFGVTPRLAPIREFEERVEAAERERLVITRVRREATTRRRSRLEARKQHLVERIERWRDPAFVRALNDPAAEAALAPELQKSLRLDRKDLSKRLRDALHAEAPTIANAAIRSATLDSYRAALRHVLGREMDLEKVDPGILPSFMYYERLGRMNNNRRYLRRLIEDRLEGRPHDWLRTEPPAAAWAGRVVAATPGIRLERWRAPFAKKFSYRPKDVRAEKRRRIREDLAQTRRLFERLGVEDVEGADYEALRAKLVEIRNAPPKSADPAVLEEIATNLERIRIAEQSSDSDFEGAIELTVETDPFQILFMGEYGFASCLSLRGSNVWGAVSNAIDIDKAVIWAKEPGGNIVGRRLVALTPEGVLSFRTYTNRGGMALDAFFEEFVADYAKHCGTQVAHGVKAGPLLSDAWYDDGSI